jgi:hypothetical protein
MDDESRLEGILLFRRIVCSTGTATLWICDTADRPILHHSIVETIALRDILLLKGVDFLLSLVVCLSCD